MVETLKSLKGQQLLVHWKKSLVVPNKVNVPPKLLSILSDKPLSGFC